MNFRELFQARIQAGEVDIENHGKEIAKLEERLKEERWAVLDAATIGWVGVARFRRWSNEPYQQAVKPLYTRSHGELPGIGFQDIGNPTEFVLDQNGNVIRAETASCRSAASPEREGLSCGVEFRATPFGHVFQAFSSKAEAEAWAHQRFEALKASYDQLMTLFTLVAAASICPLCGSRYIFDRKGRPPQCFPGDMLGKPGDTVRLKADDYECSGKLPHPELSEDAFEKRLRAEPNCELTLFERAVVKSLRSRDGKTGRPPLAQFRVGTLTSAGRVIAHLTRNIVIQMPDTQYRQAVCVRGPLFICWPEGVNPDMEITYEEDTETLQHMVNHRFEEARFDLERVGLQKYEDR